MKLPRQIKQHSTWTRSNVLWEFSHNFTSSVASVAMCRWMRCSRVETDDVRPDVYADLEDKN